MKTVRPECLVVVAIRTAVFVVLSSQTATAEITDCFGDPGVALCPVGTSVCQVNTNVVVKDGAVLDCEDHELLIRNGLGKLTVAGAMTIKAKDLTIESTRSVEAVGTSSKYARISIDLEGSLYLSGQLSARNSGGGSIVEVNAGSDIVLEQREGTAIDVVGVGQSVDGGELVLRAGRDLWIGSRVLADGNEGTSSENRTSGGTLRLEGGRHVYINHLVRGYGRWFNGGDLAIVGGGDVSIHHDGTTNGRKGEINLQGHGIDGDGGTLTIRAGGAVLQSGPILLSAGVGNVGGDAQGGEMSIVAGCGGVRLEDTLDLLGGGAGGGRLSIESRGNIAIASTVSLNAQKLGGDGGDVMLNSRAGSVTIESSGRIYTNGHITSNPNEGVGGSVLLHGCQVDVAGGAILESTGQSKGRFEALSYRNGSQLQNTFGIRISENADVNSYSTGERIVLRTPTIVNGSCSGSPSTACRFDSDCPAVGCTAGSCVGGNPQTDGQVLQFSSVPSIEQDATLGPCPASCQ